MKRKTQTQAILDLLHDEQFCKLRKQADQDLVLRTNFEHEKMPKGYSVDETWAILTAIRRQTAHLFPMASYVYPGSPATGWYSLNHALTDLIARIETLTQTEQSKGIASFTSDRYTLSKYIAEDVSAAAARDGIIISEARINEMILRDKSAVNAKEKLVSNVISILLEIDTLAQRTVSSWVILDLVDRITLGCEDLSYEAVPRHASRSASKRYTEGRTREALDVLCELINKTHTHDLQERVPDMIFLSSIMWDFAPFDAWNNLIEVVLRHLTYLKNGYEILRWVPFSKLIYQWENNTLKTPSIPFDFYYVEDNIGEGYDGTASLYAHVLILLTHLEIMLNELEEKKKADQELLSALPLVSKMNFRQQYILRQAIGNPEVGLKIKAHKDLYGIAYATARSDFLNLEKAGFLISNYEGKTLVFRLNKTILNQAGQAF